MGGKASIQGDVYSYGILLLEMFTGKRPTDEAFRGDLNIHQYAKMALPQRLMQIVDRSLLRREVEVTTTTIAEDKDMKDNIEAQSETNIDENHSHMNENMEKCLRSVLEIGLGCSVESPKERMNMGEVVRELLCVKNTFLGFASRGDRICTAQL
ncbi:Tyrosine-protein kinase [Trema orientale]|uniref:Tyrosine-protein kinase n=1 Tax=Trema orientale TaxID=63057 RepID=A0A2P5G0I5_TREOI|nr:Tyrosine-protein kinase [Trema orientale]